MKKINQKQPITYNKPPQEINHQQKLIVQHLLTILLIENEIKHT
jgi:hypothetical protein